MNSSGRFFLPFVIAAIVVLGLTACDSPLGIDTPRKEYLDRIGTPVRMELCDPVSIVAPVDTSKADSNFSAVLVLDGSGSISPQLNLAMKAAGQAFLDSLDGDTDEAAIVFFNSVATVYQRMTRNVPSLRNAVEALPIVGATAMWDGIYTGLLELEAKGTHARKAVVVITETKDNSSTMGTPTKIISLAKSARIPVYTISLAISIDETKLAEIAMESGGQHYRLPLLSQLNGIHREIAHRLKTP